MSTHRTSGDRFKRHLSILHPTQVRSMLYGAMVLVGVGFLASCSETPTGSEPTSDSPVFKPGNGNGGGGGGGSTAPDPVVDDFDPKEGFQTDTIDMVVTGSEFLQGDEVRLERNGGAADGTTTLSTTFVSTNELNARIAIDDDATPGDVNVAVLGARGSGKGRKGVGSEAFAIIENDQPKVITLEATQSNLLVPDAEGPIYRHGECGTKALWDNVPGFLTFRPLDNGLTKKDERDLANDPSCPTFPRSATLDLSVATVVGYCVNPPDADVCPAGGLVVPAGNPTLAELAVQPNAPVDDPEGREGLLSAAVRSFDGSGSLAPGGFNVAYCLDDRQAGRPLRFDPARNPGSSELSVLFDAFGEASHVSTQPAPDNVGSCAHVRSNGDIVVLLLRIDLAYAVANP